MATISQIVPWTVLAQAAKDGQGAGIMTLAMPILAIGMLFYFMIWRPEQRKRAVHNQMLANLKKNDPIVTAGGIYGTVVNVQTGSEEVTVRVDEKTNTKLRILRSSISRVITEENSGEKAES